jgi:hypothetical protein
MAQWAVEWLVAMEGNERTIPALTFLQNQPISVQRQLLAILDAVRSTGPDQWRDTTTHDPMSGICADLHEARDRHDQTLYRLYLKWQRPARRVIILTGASKPNDTALPDKFYEELAELAATTTTSPPPFATVDDVVRLTLKDRT